MSAGKLESYRSKRDPTKTPEPIPKDKARRPAAKKSSAKPPSRPDRFVIQEHHARALHWDFRLERDGVLVSWALPKGLPLDPDHNHLAIHTEDHPLEYGSFEGKIPQGQYGGGTVTISDRGTYECEKWSDHEVMVVLHGGKVEGRYVLFRTKKGPGSAKPDGWMIHRMDAAPEGFEPLPELIRPMLCRPGDLPERDAGLAYEMKWDGVRAVAYVDGGRVRYVSRNDLDVTVSYPELRGLGDALASHPAVVDGEIVALDDGGRPSFRLLQQRMHVADAARARRLADTVPVSYMIFDVLHLDGRSTLELSYDERRARLESLHLAGPSWATPPAFVDASGADVFGAAVDQGLEGVVAKRRDSPYRPGQRPGTWVKVKHFRTQEVVIGGWTPGKGARSGDIGALLLGLPEVGGLRYVGKVGTGFTDETLHDLGSRLASLEQTTSPFAGVLPKAQVAGARWAEPALVGEVRFTEWTGERRLRHPSWRGLREDKTPGDVVVES